MVRCDRYATQYAARSLGSVSCKFKGVRRNSCSGGRKFRRQCSSVKMSVS